jgi:putative ABC transport system permease protein
MILFRLALQSLRNRWITAALTVFATALSVMLFLGVEKVRTGARASFAGTLSGTDLIMGARSGGVQLLLYSVFRIGNATNNVSWESYRDIAALPEVDWIVPISLGDSHRGFRVVGTTAAYFEHYRYRGGRSLEFVAGAPFGDLFDAVLGVEVAERLGYSLGDAIVVSHGIASFSHHDDKPFRVAGILARTGTPVDRAVHVTLEGIEAIHIDWQGGGSDPASRLSADEVRALDLTPGAVTAALIGMKSRLSVFRVQRTINDYPQEALLAILPGVALQELWDLIGTAEVALAGVSGMVVVTALLGLATMIFASLNERRREMAILRAIGARPRTVVGLLVIEAGVLAGLGVALGTAMLYAALWLVRPWVDAQYGLHLPLTPPDGRELAILGAIVLAGIAVSLAPAWRAYRLSLADGMTVRT